MSDDEFEAGEDYGDYEDDYEYNDECDPPELKREPSYPDAFRVPDGSFNVLDYSDMSALMSAMVKEAEGVLGVSGDTALILLSHFGWNKEKLLDTYWADTEACMRAAGLSSGAPALGDPSAAVTCSICYDELRLADTVHLNCGHTFCRDCYAQYLTIKVDSEGSACVKTHCPEPKCAERVPDSLFKELLSEESFGRYRDFSIKNFIETSSFIRYCPAAGCDKVAIGRGITNVVCMCSNPFCFRCGEESHDPATCAQLSKWLDKCRDESETANWMIVNTKKCPKCDARTEKNQGCNHMTCRMCKHDYCWICMGPWSEHGQGTGGYYSCNKFVDPNAQVKDDAKSAAVELERYLHYYTRFRGHDSSMEHAQKVQMAAVNARVAASEEADPSGAWVDAHFLRDAVLQVIECRRVLKYTYVLGFFLGNNAAHKELFEHHQAMLEKNTDLLSEYTEMPVVDKANVVNFTGITKQFMNNLLSAMMDPSQSGSDAVGYGGTDAEAAAEDEDGESAAGKRGRSGKAVSRSRKKQRR